VVKGYRHTRGGRARAGVRERARDTEVVLGCQGKSTVL